MTLTLGIPSLGISPSLIRVLRTAVKLSIVDEILVGINPGSGDLSTLEEFRADGRVRIVMHKKNLGLHGNFRSLVQMATSDFFLWHCIDDQISTSLINQSQFWRDSEIKLYIPSWVWSEYDPETLSFDDKTTVQGVYPSLKSPKEIIRSAIYAEPSWIFGIWNTKYLKSIFPTHDFDWLDVYLLQRVVLDLGVSVCEVADPTIIGTWHWANKIPHAVNGIRHNPARALLYQFRIAPRIVFIYPPGIRLCISRAKSLVIQSKKMNALLKNERSEHA